MCLLNASMRALMVRKTATSLASSALVTFREHVAKEALASGEVRFYGGSAEKPAEFQYANGSTITLGGLDKATRVMSTEYDLIYCQEATECTEDDWETLTTRLRNGKVSFQQLMADCNPGAPQHWLNQRCQRGLTTMIFCRHEDNPRLWDGLEWTAEGQSYIERLDNLTGVRRERLRFGRWAAAEGLVYSSFDPEIHLYKHILLPPPSWNRYLSIDFGFTNPLVVQWWAEDPDGRLFLYKELYKTGLLVEDAAELIKRHQRTHSGPEPEPVAIICDHDAEDRATLERKLGRSTVAATKNVSEGIQAVQERLKVAKDGRPRLFLCRDAVPEKERDPALAVSRKPACAIDEITEYVWDTRPQPGTSTRREAPAKVNDHSMDAMRYMVAYLDVRGRPGFRWL